MDLLCVPKGTVPFYRVVPKSVMGPMGDCHVQVEFSTPHGCPTLVKFRMWDFVDQYWYVFAMLLAFIGLSLIIAPTFSS